MTVTLIARPQFLGLPAALGTPREDQLQGPDAQKLIETAARTCYDSFGKGRGSDDHARHILSVNHGSVLEHGFYSFFITDASRGWSHEHVRHRVGIAISQRSTRYVDETQTPWIRHPLLVQYLDATNDGSLEAAWDMAIVECRDAYEKIVERLEGYLIARGTDKLTARKQARGAARGILGNALMTEMVWSANVRMLRTVIDQRANPAADAEIRGVAIDILRIMAEGASNLLRRLHDQAKR
jgi:thymidylate synthase (FAD)